MTPTIEARGQFVDASGDTWYRIDQPDPQRPFFMTLAGDSDLWAFVSSAGSLTAGRRDPDGAFFPYETVDKIHRRWQHTGPRTWIRLPGAAGALLWQPFAAWASTRCSMWIPPQTLPSSRKAPSCWSGSRTAAPCH